MKKRKVFVALLLLVVIFGVMASGCGKKVSTNTIWAVNTGDKLSIEVSDESGFTLSKEVPFKLSKDGKEVSTGTFLEKAAYEQYIKSIKDDGVTKLLKEDKNEDIEYTFFSYGESEYSYLIYILNSQTAIKLENTTSAQSAQEAFEALTIKLESE